MENSTEFPGSPPFIKRRFSSYVRGDGRKQSPFTCEIWRKKWFAIRNTHRLRSFLGMHRTDGAPCDTASPLASISVDPLPMRGWDRVRFGSFTQRHFAIPPRGTTNLTSDFLIWGPGRALSSRYVSLSALRARCCIGGVLSLDVRRRALEVLRSSQHRWGIERTIDRSPSLIQPTDTDV